MDSQKAFSRIEIDVEGDKIDCTWLKVVEGKNIQIDAEIEHLRTQQSDFQGSVNEAITVGLEDIRDRVTKTSVREIVTQIPDEFRQQLQIEFDQALVSASKTIMARPRDIFFFLGRGVADMERPAAPSIRPPRSRSAPRCPVSWSSVRRSISRSTSSSSSKSGLNWLTEAKPRKAIVEKAQTPQHSSRTSAIIIALRNRRFPYAERLRVPSKPLAVRRKFALTVGHGQSI